MRMMIFFDLPMTTSAEKRSYRIFRKEIQQLGFVMLQESVYVKLALTPTVADSLRIKLHQIKPPRGLVQVLTVTEKQYAAMETIVGEWKSSVIDSHERFVVL